MREPGTVQSVQRALNLLEVITTAGEGSVHGLARHLTMAPSTVHRFLNTLERLGYLDRGESRKQYRPSFKVFELAAQITLRRVGFLEAARPHLFQLALTPNAQSVAVGVLDGNDVVVVERIALVQVPNPVATWGGRLPCRAAALGRAILSALPAPKLEEWLQQWQRQSQDPMSVAEIDALRAEIDATRERGYGLSPGESGGRAAAAPIRNYTGLVVAAVSIRVGDEHLTSKSLASMGRLIVRTANEISYHLGYRGEVHRRSGQSVGRDKDLERRRPAVNVSFPRE